jgi:hypothetical protein
MGISKTQTLHFDVSLRSPLQKLLEFDALGLENLFFQLNYLCKMQ